MIPDFLKLRELFAFSEFNQTRVYNAIILAYSLFTFSLYIFLSEASILKVGEEDGGFEYLTAFSFLIASVLCLMISFRSRNIWFALLAIVFFVGFGEEISWGQRILGYGTPESVNSKNVQGEFNMHNLEILDSKDFSGEEKSGWRKFTAVQFLYNLFWFTYGIALPLAVFYLGFVKKLVTKFRLPVPPLAIGIFFMVDWLIFRISKSLLLPAGKSIEYYYTINEMFESCSALIFMMIIIWFFVKRAESLTEKTISG